MAQIILPKTLQGHTPALADDVMADLNALAARLNNGVETDNIADSAVTSAKIADGSIVNADVNSAAALALAKLESLATGQIIAGNGGVATARTLAGAGTIDASGDLSLGHFEVVASSDTVVHGDGVTWTTIATATLPAGVWQAHGKISMWSDVAAVLKARLMYGGVALDEAQGDAVGTGLGKEVALPLLYPVVFSSDTTSTLRIEALATAAGGTQHAGVGGILCTRFQ